MKIGLINFSGNVGKTTLARHLFSPRLGCEIVSIETINADGDEVTILKGKDYVSLQDEMLLAENLVIDVGASNVEDFLASMSKFDGSNIDIDLFVVPVVPAMKQQRDTIATIGELVDRGIDLEKLRVVLNQVEINDDYEKTFRLVLEYCSVIGVQCVEEVVIENELYDMLKNNEDSIEDLLSDETDYKAAIADCDTRDEKIVFARKIAKQRLAKGVKKHLDVVYSSVVA